MGSHFSYLFDMLDRSFTMRMSSIECECECECFRQTVRTCVSVYHERAHTITQSHRDIIHIFMLLSALSACC
jgi:hypothetical protein